MLVAASSATMLQSRAAGCWSRAWRQVPRGSEVPSPMLGMGHLMCGTLTDPRDNRTAILGGTKAVSAPETDGSSVGQEGVGIQPCLSPSIRRDTQSFLPVCNWWAQGFLRRRQMGPSLSPVLGLGKRGSPWDKAGPSHGE